MCVCILIDTSDNTLTEDSLIQELYAEGHSAEPSEEDTLTNDTATPATHVTGESFTLTLSNSTSKVI